MYLEYQYLSKSDLYNLAVNSYSAWNNEKVGIQQCMPETHCLVLKSRKGYDMEIASNHHTVFLGSLCVFHWNHIRKSLATERQNQCRIIYFEQMRNNIYSKILILITVRTVLLKVAFVGFFHITHIMWFCLYGQITH